MVELMSPVAFELAELYAVIAAAYISGFILALAVCKYRENKQEQRHRYRQAMLPSTDGTRWSGTRSPVYLTDQKRVDPPKLDKEPAPEPVAPPVAELRRPDPDKEAPAKGNAQADIFAALEEGLKAGPVQIAVAPTLYPTPHDLAARMAELAGITADSRVLEPSAGTGVLVDLSLIHI